MITSGLTWTVDELDGVVRISLAGAITETTDFTAVLAGASGQVRLSLEGITMINSTGVREWIQFITRLCSCSTVTLERCSPPMVQQMNLIRNMTGSAHVASVMLPYACTDCNHEATQVLELGGDACVIEEEICCSACKGAMEFDDMLEFYLDFLAQPG